MAKRTISAGVLVGLLLALWALPVAAQEPLDEPYADVAPVVVERPQPQVDDNEDNGVTEDNESVTEVAGNRLARTGLRLSVGMVLALALLLGGGAALYGASRWPGFDRS